MLIAFLSASFPSLFLSIMYDLNLLGVDFPQTRFQSLILCAIEFPKVQTKKTYSKYMFLVSEFLLDCLL